MTASRPIDEPQIPPAEVWARLQAVFGLDKLTSALLAGEEIRNGNGYGEVTFRFVKASTSRSKVVVEKTIET